MEIAVFFIIVGFIIQVVMFIRAAISPHSNNDYEIEEEEEEDYDIIYGNFDDEDDLADFYYHEDVEDVY